MRLPLAKVRPHITFDRENFTLNVELLAAPLPPEQAVGLTPSGLLLPPGVAQKLSARAALAEAEALLESLPAAPPSAAGDLSPLLAAVQDLAARLTHAQTQLAQTEARLQTLESPNPAVALLERDPLFLDLETTGLKKTDAVVEVAVIDRRGRVLLNTLVDPQRPIPPAAAAVNGLTDHLVAGAPTWDQVLPLLEQTLSGRVVVAHNVKFEAKFLPGDWPVEWTCSKRLADNALGKRAGFGSLAARLQQLGLRPGPAHSAAGDALSCLRLVKRLAGDPSPVELTNLSN